MTTWHLVEIYVGQNLIVAVPWTQWLAAHVYWPADWDISAVSAGVDYAVGLRITV